ncbi:hypothetical protein [Weissella tructae]|uniref:hypothetical protein n=1 Tax=Weissella tructae TaxID=887702 RepID=UPI001BDD53F8|nr:hypothetical protein [Weissella tructae]QVV90836.1 hypothetical protein KHQ32_04170 [Weissella tructae]
MSSIRYQVLAKTDNGGYVVHMGVKSERYATTIAKDALKRKGVVSTSVMKLTNGVKVKRDLVIEFKKGERRVR